MAMFLVDGSQPASSALASPDASERERSDAAERLASIVATAASKGLPRITETNAAEWFQRRPDLNKLRGKIHAALRNADDGPCSLRVILLAGDGSRMGTVGR